MGTNNCGKQLREAFKIRTSEKIIKKEDFQKYLLQYFSIKINHNTMLATDQCPLKALLKNVFRSKKLQAKILNNMIFPHI